MASRRRDDEGQVILLAGVLLVLAFILFSVQLSVLTNLGAQVGRETENPLLEDYLLVRRSLETVLRDELRDTRTSTLTPCPEPLEYGYRVKGILGLMSTLEANRGQSFHWDGLRTSNGAAAVIVRIDLRFTDGVTTVGEQVNYTVSCTAPVAPPASCTGAVCIIP